MRILIVDYTTHHPEVNAALLDIFSGHDLHFISTSSFDEKYFVSGDLTRPLKCTFKTRNMGDREWIASISALVAEQELIIFSTGLKSKLLAETLRIETPAKKIVYVHNVNYFIERELVSYAVYRDLMASWHPDRFALLSAYFKEWLRQRRKRRDMKKYKSRFADLRPYIDYYCFANGNLAKYFTDVTGIDNALTLPTNSRDIGSARPSYHGALNIAILGNVRPDRKDYEGVIAALARNPLRNPINLHLLGASSNAAYARKLEQLIDAIDNPNLTVHYATHGGFIPTPDLLKILNGVHLLLSPIQTRFLFHLHLECYGRTKASGSDADSLVYNRPVLLPTSYSYGEQIASFVVQYRDYDDLCAVLNGLNDAAALGALYARSEGLSLRTINDDIQKRFLQKLFISAA